MIKKIDIHDLRVGMYIERLDSSWLKHPFLFSKQKIVETNKQLRKLQSAGVREIFINTELGLDVIDPVFLADSKPRAVQNPAPQALEPDVPEEASPPPESVEAIPLSREVETARALYSSATQFVRDFFHDARAGRTIDYKEAGPLIDGIIQSVFRNSNALSILANLRSHEEYTYTHSVNVAALSVVFGKSLGLRRKDLYDLGIGGLFHDIGKFRIPDEILKKPGELTQKEFEIVKKHPHSGYRLMQGNTDLNDRALRVILEHHERYDGGGYPSALHGAQISKAANMVSIVDAYDALTADRAYRRAVDPHFALKTMYLERKERYYYDLMERFIKCLGIYPVGSFVKLTNGHYAIVIEADPANPLTPTVKIMLDKNMRRLNPEIVRLSQFGAARKEMINIVEGLNPEKLTLKRKLLSQAVFG